MSKFNFDEVLKDCPFLKGLIEDKIAEEVAKKDVEIVALKEDLTEANTRLGDTENVLNMILEVM